MSVKSPWSNVSLMAAVSLLVFSLGGLSTDFLFNLPEAPGCFLRGLCVPSCCSWSSVAAVNPEGGVDPQADWPSGLAVTMVDEVLSGG